LKIANKRRESLFFLKNLLCSAVRGLSHGRLVAVFLLPGLLSACTGDLPDTPPPAGMQLSGKYPSMNTPLAAATTQMSDAQAADMAKRLDSLAPASSTASNNEAEYQRKLKAVRKLATDAQSSSAPEN
jgi:hypothetical protein